MLTKKLFRVNIQHFLRELHLLKPTERLRFLIKKKSLRRRNKKFVEENPGFTIPPQHLAFDAYSAPHWVFYKLSGDATAKFLDQLFKKHFPADQYPKSIYEWGCGPGRVIRQLTAVVPAGTRIFGSDYNPETIEWCQKNLSGIEFSLNGLQPPLNYEDGQFDFVYAISVFTHLSEENSLQWINELHRILRPGGVLLITQSGDDSYKTELLHAERKTYDTTGIVVRGKYEEGKKMFLTIHSPSYIRNKLLKDFEILDHQTSSFPYMRQDYWIARK
jgi:SAM-dependent methyltransferase